MKKGIYDKKGQFKDGETLSDQDEYLLFLASQAMYNQDLHLFNRFNEDEEEIPNLDEFDRRMHDKINIMYKEGKKYGRRKLIYKATGIVAAIAIISSLFNTGIFGKADAFFAKMMRFIMKDEGTYTEFRGAIPEENLHIKEFEGYYYPRYIPDDYEIDLKHNMEVMGTIIYRAKDNYNSRITYSFSTINAPQQLDTENCERKEILINDQIGLLYTKKDGSCNMIVFHNDEYKFVLFGDINVEILKQIAQSINK